LSTAHWHKIKIQKPANGMFAGFLCLKAIALAIQKGQKPQACALFVYLLLKILAVNER
jgi:hypothetical protein|tara:strand:- start:180 stop:353 length:174 start_codon:yes stop_codon:yes gene_type:complete